MSIRQRAALAFAVSPTVWLLFGTRLYTDPKEALFEAEVEVVAVMSRSAYPSFMADVAHELRTPLTSIQGCAEMALDPDVSADQQSRFLRIIVGECARLAHLASDILIIQQIEDGTIAFQRNPVDLCDVVYTAAALCGFGANELLCSPQDSSPIAAEGKSGKRASLPDIRITVSDCVPCVVGDSAYLRCAVSHLIENAVHFAGPNGIIRVLISSEPKYATVEVCDDGCGFGAIDPDLLFAPFFRMDPSRQRGTSGAGLGLSYVKAVAERHGGFAQARNLPEGGACFTIGLPIPPASKESLVTVSPQLLQSA